ncbi:MAG: terminase family protein, partial [Candidatus Marinimicrobia bacterium]|nr:terminase family protein [Candidatus Neomarinimicrobiota bacterium]
GGAVFSGKTYALTLDALRDTPHMDYVATIFRRSYPQIIQSLVPTAQEIYSGVRYNSYAQSPTPSFKFFNDVKKKVKRAEINFSHIYHEKDLETHQGLQSPFIGFDELEHFSKKMFTYMFSRNRSRAKMPASVNTQRIRASCNPLPGSWLAELLIEGGYIQPDGYPDPAMRGKVLYMYHINDEWVFSTDRDSLWNKYKLDSPPYSFTFVPGTMDDNAIGNENNKGYASSLLALSSYDYDVLVKGNWMTVRTGAIFTRDLFHEYWLDDIVKRISITHKAIFVDTAQAIGKENDFTVFLCVGVTPKNELVILDMYRDKLKPMAAYRIAQAFYEKHNQKQFHITNLKTGTFDLISAAPLQGMYIEYANRGIDILMHMRDLGYQVGPIKRQGKVAEGQRGNDKVSRAIAALPLLKKSGIWLPGDNTRHSGNDGWCENDPKIRQILEPGESVCTDPKIWKSIFKSELMGFKQGENKKEASSTNHDDICDPLIDSANFLLNSKGLSWLQSMLSM